MKVSVIDLGFNSVKLVNYDIRKDGTFKAYQQEGVKVKLGEGLNETGYLGKEQMDRTIRALRVFRDIINFDSIRHVLPVATSAVREAGNKVDFLKQVYSQTGFQFKVLSGQEKGILEGDRQGRGPQGAAGAPRPYPRQRHYDRVLAGQRQQAAFGQRDGQQMQLYKKFVRHMSNYSQ